jgi:N-acetylmuramoyl-L-alanine amidase
MDGYVGRRSFPGLRVSIDPAHGGSDHGVGKSDTRGGIPEKDLNLALGKQLKQLLESMGVIVYLLRESDAGIPLYERTEAANAWEPDIHLCLHHSASTSRSAQGAATYYFANKIYQSRAGKRLAGYIVDALCRDLGRVDLHKHGRNFASLREVKPLAVLVELGFMSHPVEGPTLADPEVIAREAQAVARGLEAYLSRV